MEHFQYTQRLTAVSAQGRTSNVKISLHGIPCVLTDEQSRYCTANLDG